MVQSKQVLRIRIRPFTLMWIWILLLIKVMQLSDHLHTDRPSMAYFKSPPHASNVSVLGPPWLHFDADPAFHSNADPNPASQNDADPDPQHCKELCWKNGKNYYIVYPLSLYSAISLSRWAGVVFIMQLPIIYNIS
jgi:hypothetical protein